MQDKTLKILFLGDVVGRPGREAVAKIMPQLKEDFSPDLTIANAENVAHGKGITENTLKDLQNAGVDFFTSGNHVWKKEGRRLVSEKKFPILRPANYPEGVPGRGFQILNIFSKKIAIINLIGQTFFRNNYTCPFIEAKKILKAIEHENCNAVLIDFHAETTSEKRALGYYLDGQVSALIGTHTHVQTADDQILPNGTAYLTDAGMCGVRHSILGKNKEQVIQGFLQLDAVDSDWDDEWQEAIVQGVLVEIKKNGKAKEVKRINKVVIN
jgi:metallophosphoesterase (TIGR00282 family)